MNLLWYILIGLVVGVIARLLIPGRENMGIFMTIILGAFGAFLAGILGEGLNLYTFPSWAGFFVAILFAAILIGLYAALKGPRRRRIF